MVASRTCIVTLFSSLTSLLSLALFDLRKIYDKMAA